MRSRIEARRTGKARKSAKVSFKGGKALQRLLYFGSQRQASLNAEAVSASHVPKSAIPKWAQQGAARSIARGKRRKGQAPIKSIVDVAKTYAKTAELLKGESPTPSRTAAARAPAAGPAWKDIGPTCITHGQTYGVSRVDVSGRVSSLAIDPKDTKHLLCGSAGGGIWETFDSGKTWQQRTDQMPTLTIGAVAFDPSDNKIVYAGSGEGNSDAGFGVGVYLSRDGGTTWTVLATKPFVGIGFYDLIVDPKKPKTLYAATTGGFYVSTNSGVKWSLKRDEPCWDISVHPTGGGGAELLAAFEGGLFVSTNFGNAFTAVPLPATLTPPWLRLAVDHCRTDPRVAFVFGAKEKNARLYQRSAAGAWTQKNMPKKFDLVQAWYDWLVTASDQPGQVYIGAIDLLRGDPQGANLKWVPLSTKKAAGSSSIHPDQHCLVIDPVAPDTIYCGNDGGVFRSKDRGITWKELNNTLGITEIEFIAHRPDNSKWLLAGTQDNGTIRYTGSLTWKHVADGDGGDCAVNPLKLDEAYHTFYGVEWLERSTAAGDWDTWTLITIPGTGDALFYPPLEVFGKTVARAGVKAFVSRNNGGSWVAIGGLGFSASNLASAMTMPSADQFYVGSQGGNLCRLDWSGAAWKVTALTSPRAAWMSDITIDPNDPKTLWLTYTTLNGPHVFRSNDGGGTWSDRTANLPPLPMNAIIVDPKDSKRVFVAADLGVYESLDAGGSWAAYGAGLPNALAVDLAFHEADRLLFCATRNRGCWTIGV